MKKFIIQAMLALFVLAIGYAGMKGLQTLKKPQKKQSRPPVVKTVKVKAVEKQAMYPVIRALGQIKSEQPVQLAAEVAGSVMPSDFGFKSGAHFKKGQVLVVIDSRRAELNLKSAVSSLLNALASVLPEIKADIPAEYEKWNKFFAATSFKDLPELPEITDQKEKLYMSRFNVYNLYFAASSLQITLEKHFLKAPFNGTVINSNIRAGSMVGTGAPLGTIVRTDKMEIEIPLSTVDAEWIDKKAKVTFTIAESGEKYAGTVDRMAQAMTGGSQTISAYIAVDRSSAAGLMDGMYAEVEFKGKELKDAFSIPRRAVVGRNGIYLVKDGRLHSAKVLIPRFGIDEVFLTEGVSNGDTVVVETVQDAIEGMSVKSFILDEKGEWMSTSEDSRHRPPEGEKVGKPVNDGAEHGKQ